MGLCDEASELGPWFDMADWEWPDWPTIRLELIANLRRPADYFRQISVRRQFKWLLRWYSNTPSGSSWHSACPVGILALRIFTLLLSNDADRCIQLRDARVGLELMQYSWTDVVAAGYPIFHMLARLAEETRRVSFPLDNVCDALGRGNGSDYFRSELVDAFSHGERLPVAEVEPHLPDPHASLPSLGRTACPFTQAAALFTVAAAGAARHLASVPTGTSPAAMAPVAVPIELPSDSRQALEHGQELLRDWRPLRHSLYDLITTRWPIWRSLERVAAPFGTERVERRRKRFSVELVVCGDGWRGLREATAAFVEAQGWYAHYLWADVEACPAFYTSISGSLPGDAYVIQLSPLLWTWNVGLEEALVTAVSIIAGDPEIDIVGFPSLTEDLLWSLNVRRIQMRDWALRYSAYPTGYEFTRGDRCFACMATSATRVFRNVHLWKKLYATDVQGTIKVGTRSSWLVGADLHARRMGLRTYTCVTPPIPERNYLAEAQLTPVLSRLYGVEVAQFDDSIVATRCLELHDWAFLRTDLYAESLEVSHCIEQDAQMALAVLGRWWCASGNHRFLAAVPGVQTAPLLLTHGATLLQPGQMPRTPVPLELHACCSAGDPLAECPLPHAVEVVGLPPDLQFVAGDALVVRSVRANATVLRLLPCDAVTAASLADLSAVRTAASVLDPAFAAEQATSGTVAREALWPFLRLHNTKRLDIKVLPAQLPPSTGTVPSQVALLSCAPSAPLAGRIRTFAEKEGWVAFVEDIDLRGCLGFLQRSIGSVPDNFVAILLSPLLWGWSDEGAGRALAAAVSLAGQRGAGSILGFPTVSPSGEWQWRVRQIRNQYWKLMYALPRGLSSQRAHVLAPRGGSPTVHCAHGNAASSSKVFGASGHLRQLLSVVRNDPDNAFNWFVDLDLQTLEMGLPVISCLVAPLPEQDYLPRATLSKYLSTRYEVEVAEFIGERHERCLAGANWFEVLQKGLVAPWCFRRDVEKAFRDVHEWWTMLDPRKNFVVPEEGTFLAVFRNGASGMMPWDSDFDAKLYTESPLTVPEFMNMTEQASFKRMEIEAYAYKGCGQDNYVLLRRPNITHHIGDMYVRGEQQVSSHPWRVRLFGTEVRLSPEHLEHIFFVRYRTPVRKLFGDGLHLQCFLPLHRACMPDCRDEALPCEFEDEFVHVDDFSLRSQPLLWPV